MESWSLGVDSLKIVIEIVVIRGNVDDCPASPRRKVPAWNRS